MKNDRVLSTNNDAEYASSKKQSSDENETDRSPPRKILQGMLKMFHRNYL